MITVLPSLTVFAPSLTVTVLPSLPLYTKGKGTVRQTVRKARP
jgi:hypothetical protein